MPETACRSCRGEVAAGAEVCGWCWPHHITEQAMAWLREKHPDVFEDMLIAVPGAEDQTWAPPREDRHWPTAVAAEGPHDPKGKGEDA